MRLRTYWTGTRGTYCDLCFWGTDDTGSVGVNQWVAHAADVHPHATSRIAGAPVAACGSYPVSGKEQHVR